MNIFSNNNGTTSPYFRIGKKGASILSGNFPPYDVKDIGRGSIFMSTHGSIYYLDDNKKWRQIPKDDLKLVEAIIYASTIQSTIRDFSKLAAKVAIFIALLFSIKNLVFLVHQSHLFFEWYFIPFKW